MAVKLDPRAEAAITAAASAITKQTIRIWHDLSVAIERDAAILKTGTDPGAAAFSNLDSLKFSDMKGLVTGALESIITAEFDVTGAVFAPIIKAMLAVHSNALSSLKNVKPGDEQVPATTLLSEAVGAGVGAHFAAVAAETLYPFKQLGLPQMAALLAQLAGFGEIMSGILEPEMAALITIPHRYATNARARSTLPNERDALNLYSRGVITDAATETLLGYAGISTDYTAAIKTGAYRPLQPRALAALLIDSPFPAAQIQDALTFAGLRPSDITFLLPLLEANSTRTVRQGYLTALEQSVELGTDTPQALSQAMQDMNYSATAQNWVQLTIAERKLEQLAELYRKSVSESYRYGTITDDQYVPALEAIGIDAADAQAHYAIDSIAKNGKILQAALRAEERLARSRISGGNLLEEHYADASK